jgi:dolichol-phosphate mannosyltransferase
MRFYEKKYKHPFEQPRPMSHTISVVLPTYNEKPNILALIHQVHEQLSGYEHEIIVVDDNSADGTYEIVRGQQLPYVRAVLRTSARGFAFSIREGLEKASGNVLVVMDSDFNHQPKYLPFMIESLRFYDAVFASRFLYGGRMDPRSRHLLSWMFNIYIRLLTNGQITDSLYGYFAVKRQAIQDLDYNKIFWGYGDYCIRLAHYLQKKKVLVLQFPAVNGERIGGQGNRRFFSTFWEYFRAVTALAYRIWVHND